MHTNHRPVTVIEPPSLTAFRPVRALRRLAGARDLLWTLSAHRLSVRHKQTRLGVAWAICSRAQSCWRSVVFALLGGAPSDGVPYPLFAYAALVPWSAFASGLANSTTSLTGHAALVTRVSFPREILPLTYVLAAMTDALLASVVLTGLMAWYGIAPAASTIAWLRARSRPRRGSTTQRTPGHWRTTSRVALVTGALSMTNTSSAAA